MPPYTNNLTLHCDRICESKYLLFNVQVSSYMESAELKYIYVVVLATDTGVT
jgi:hypothetical protein